MDDIERLVRNDTPDLRPESRRRRAVDPTTDPQAASAERPLDPTGQRWHTPGAGDEMDPIEEAVHCRVRRAFPAGRDRRDQGESMICTQEREHRAGDQFVALVIRHGRCPIDDEDVQAHART